jgi:hypothetical protein
VRWNGDTIADEIRGSRGEILGPSVMMVKSLPEHPASVFLETEAHVKIDGAEYE